MHAFEAHFHSDRHQFNQKSRRAASHIELKVAEISVGSSYRGGFQLEFVSISQVINHMTCYNSSTLIGGKFILKKSFTIFALQSECCNFNQ